MRRVGHKGADLVVPGNTRASFDAALAAGVDMIEFDVLRGPRTGRLVLAHDFEDASERETQTLEEGLEHLAGAAFAEVELVVDLKLPGYELDVLEAVRRAGLLERSLISSQYRGSLSVIRRADPTVRLGWSVPKLRRDPFRSRTLALPARAALLAMRRLLPRLAARAITGGSIDAIMAHWLLVTPRLVAQVRRSGGELYVWTVDELPRLRELQELGVTGAITNDPRLFAQLEVSPTGSRASSR